MTSTPGKRFMAELQLARRKAGGSLHPDQSAPEAPALAVVAAPAATVDNTEVLSAIAALDAKLERVLALETNDIERIQVDIADISGRIKATKAEIAALRHPLAQEDKFVIASEELGAVVRATEVATNTIIASAEELEEIVHELRSQLPEGYQSSRVNDMNEVITRIYEACNFQDLTGQRINKVVRALTFIEERVESMMSVWHKQDFATMPLPPSIIKADDNLPLTGPAEPDQGAGNISQSDIDALFG
jgi:chemotaxis protein CheZ